MRKYLSSTPIAVAAYLLAIAAAVTLALVLAAPLFRGDPPRRPVAAEPPPETVNVVLAALDIPPLTLLTAEMLKVEERPKCLVPRDTVTDLNAAVGRTVFLRPIPRGQPVRRDVLAAPGQRVDRQKFVLKTAETPDCRQGDWVDVGLAVEGARPRNAGGQMRVLLRNVFVRSVDPIERAVTLEVTPEQFGVLILAQDRGTLRLAPARLPPLDWRLRREPFYFPKPPRAPGEC
jgi:Flp pilus assembly protein CpaB